MSADLEEAIASACRILAAKGLVEGVLGHVSARTSTGSVLIRCRGPRERGVRFTEAADIREIDLDGGHLDDADGWSVPAEYPIHTELYRARPHVGAVIHAHPESALLCGLANLTPAPVFGSYNIAAMRLALEGVPVFPRAVLISRTELALEMMAAMGDAEVCLLRGHGITVTGPSVEAALVTAVNLDVLLSVTVSLARLGARPPALSAADLAELPDLGSAFNTTLAWQALVAEYDPPT